jgi:myosin heavy subunit
MRIQRLLTILVLLSSLWLATPSAWGISREIVQLQTQVQALQDQMTHMQQSFDERMGVMKNLVEQSTDSMNKVAASVTDLQGTLQKQQTDSGSHVDQLSGQIQALNDTLDELKARLAKVSKRPNRMLLHNSLSKPSNNSSKRKLLRPTCFTTTRYAITTRPRMISRPRSSPITSSTTPTLILQGMPISI